MASHERIKRMFEHKEAIDWAHNHGIKAHLHSCGDVMTRVPQLVDDCGTG